VLGVVYSCPVQALRSRLSRLLFVALVLLVGMPAIRALPARAAGRLIRVPQDIRLAQAVQIARPGDVILLAPGTYRGDLSVPEFTHDITIRGADRNKVVFDGEDRREEGIEVYGDNVAIENLTVHNFTGNGIYWESVEGFAARYVTVYNVGLYGIYALDSHTGVFEHNYVSGAADAAYYIGQCIPCNVVLTDLYARLSAIGYSGTNASGDIALMNSVFEDNGTAIMPNSYTAEKYPPQRSMRIVDNVVRDSGIVPTPANSPLAGYIGVGIAIAGGVDNIVQGNVVSGSARYGIALFPTVQRNDPPFAPMGNLVRSNVVTISGVADLAVSEGSGSGNCFARNDAQTSLPPSLDERSCADGSSTQTGDARVARDLAVPVRVALARLGKRPSYREMPVPDAQPNMPEVTDLPDARFRSPRRGYSPAYVLGLLAIAGALVWATYLGRRGRPWKKPSTADRLPSSDDREEV
jgi:hypothetical protein